MVGLSKLSSPATVSPAARPRAAAPQVKAAVMPSIAADQLVLSEAQRLDAGIRRLDRLATELEAKGDRRALFPRVYLLQLRGFVEDLKTPGRYEDPAYMTHLVRVFLDRYFVAYDAYASGDRANTPEPWRRAFDEAARGPARPARDLMLAMTAHIAHDLPLAIVDAGSTPRNQADYLKFNQVLASKIDDVQALLEEATPGGRGSLAGLADRWLYRVDEIAAGKLMVQWRDTAWEDARALQAGKPGAYEAILSRAHWRVTLTGPATTMGSWPQPRLPGLR